MTTIVGRFINEWNKILDQADPRLEHHVLVRSAWSPVILIGLYLLFVYKIGPNIMKNRPAFGLRKTMMAYNIIQVVINFLFFIKGFDYANTFNYICEPIRPISPESVKFAELFYVFLLLKMFDFLDTVIFILRKKGNQVSFLHTFHHTSTFFFTWVGCKWWPGGQASYIGFFNSLVHTVMYFYYFLTSWDPAYKQSIWWKKHLTQLQLVQDVLLVILALSALVNPHCTYPKAAATFMFLDSSFITYLFADFYFKTYIKVKKEKLLNKAE